MSLKPVPRERVDAICSEITSALDVGAKPMAAHMSAKATATDADILINIWLHVPANADSQTWIAEMQARIARILAIE